MPDARHDPEALAAARDALLLTLGAPRPADDVAASDVPTRQLLPVTVLGGFLGAGKTTLLCRLLEQSGIHIVAIVNDVAAVNVDATLVRSRSAETIELANGCACCVLGSALGSTLQEIAARPQPPAAVVIETTGLADPTGLALTIANTHGVGLDGIVVVVDAEQWQARADDPLTAALFERQLNAAHLVVLNRTGAGAASTSAEAARAALGARVPGRPVLLADAGEASAEIVLGAASHGARPAPSAQTHALNGYAVETVPMDAAVPTAALARLLEALPDCVWRIKGWLSVQDADGAVRPVALQATGRRWQLSTDVTGAAGVLVVIGKAGRGFDKFRAALAGLCGPAKHAVSRAAADRLEPQSR